MHLRKFQQNYHKRQRKRYLAVYSEHPGIGIGYGVLIAASLHSNPPCLASGMGTDQAGVVLFVKFSEVRGSCWLFGFKPME